MFDRPRHVMPHLGPRAAFFAGVTHDPAVGPASHAAFAIEASRSGLVRIVLPLLMATLSRREAATRPADKIRAVVRRDACPRARPPIKLTEH